MAAAMISAFTLRQVRRDVAMTGEITLRGEVLPIGGVKEKVLAARQAKISTVILPRLNRRDVEQINARILHDMTFDYVETVDEVLAVALRAAPERGPEPAPSIAPAEKPATEPAVREVPVAPPPGRRPHSTVKSRESRAKRPVPRA
jgi:ATP-dependent Lon protease